MPYIPPKYFAGATTIVATDVQENLDALRNYVSGDIRASDLSPTNWAGPRNIMRGRYDPIVNQYKLTSGVIASRNSETNETSWISRATTGSVGGTTPSFSCFPNSAISFYLEQDAHVIMQFYASPVNPLGTTDETKLFIYVDDTDRIAMSRNTIRSEVPAFGSAFGYSGEHQARNNFGGYLMRTLSAGQHSMSLKGTSTSSYTFLCNWGVSLEAYYK